MSCIWIASKVVNDQIISNRLFAYLLNLDVNEFNKREIDVMHRLGFNAYIPEDEYFLYDSQIKEFAYLQYELLEESLLEYKRDKKILKKEIQIHKERYLNHVNNFIEDVKVKNYNDKDMKEIMEKGLSEQNMVYPYLIPRSFRFESYNSYDIKPSKSKRKSEGRKCLSM